MYEDECGPDQPLRCYVGDISGRLGNIDIGSHSMVFSDPNLPLGKYTYYLICVYYLRNLNVFKMNI